MTPKNMPPALGLVHLRVSVEGIEFEKTFEADPELKYTYSWDRRNAYRQKVYGIVPARGKSANFIFWPRNLPHIRNKWLPDEDEPKQNQ